MSGSVPAAQRGVYNRGAMVETRIIDNATRPAGDELLSSLAWATDVRIATAFAKGSGVTRIIDPLAQILSKGGKVHVVYGLDFHITDPEAIERFRELADQYPDTLAHHAYSEWALAISHAFHPKLYICTDPVGNARVLVGSSNLTTGGLWANTEANVVIAGSKNEPVITEAHAIFTRITNRQSLFVPDQDYMERYRALHRRAAKVRLDTKPPRHLAAAYTELKSLEERLPGTRPTQKRVIVDAIRNLSSGGSEFVHLQDIGREAERLARAAVAEFDWSTFANSVRGRLNEHTLGKGGEDLFERMGGVQGRSGRYRLTDAGLHYAGR